MKVKFLMVRPYYGVNIHTDAQGEYGTVLHSEEIYPDLPMLVSATILDRSEDHEVRMIDAYVEDRMLPDELIEKIASIRYDKLIIKVTTASVKSDIELIKQIKKRNPGSYIMAAGQVAKDLKEWLLLNTEIDQIIDEPLDKFIYRYVYGKDGSLNDFPTPDYSLVNYKNYCDNSNRIRLTMLASRGCPMNCLYCPYIKYYSKYESRDVDKIIGDIRALIGFGAEVIQFRDQFFTCDKNKIKELCSRIISENIRFSWICETKLDSLDEELIDLMKEAGLFLICFGVESGNKSILEEYHSHKGELKRQQEIVGMLKDKGILTMAFYILGFPEDTWETLHETYRYAEAVNSNIVAFNEYTEYNFSGSDDLTPDTFCTFENATNVDKHFQLTREEIRYAIDLFSAMYTVSHDCLEKAYTYNYKYDLQYKNTIARIAECSGDLMSMSERIRQLR